MEKIFSELKKAMYLKKLNEIEAYKILDDNNDGFITFNEFKTNLDKIVELSENCKDGLFNYLDKSKLGMISKKRWIEIMSRYTL